MLPARFLAFAVLIILLVGIPTANAEGSWSTVSSPTTNDLYSVFMVSASDGWAVGSWGTILHYTGGSWSLYATSPTTDHLYSVFMVSASDGWAVGDYGTILHYSGPPPPVGGSIAPVNKLAVSAPYVSLLVLIGAATVAVATKRNRKT